ncbi:hypothetical protein MKEN_00525800 [Mycena kentingensis (nom. inval.)]|nr:hypothetical protein MKEN_00525800 [Mycena kentingensis (nom. inval.)]
MAKGTKSAAPPALIDGRVSLDQCQRAVDALHTHFTNREQAREGKDLLGTKDQHVWVNVTVKKIASAHRFKPVKIPISHPIVDPRVEAVCLITKDPQRKYKDLLEEHGIKFISRVVGIEKLKGKFKPFEARRLLLKQNGLFLADERVIPLLPKLLGAKWFEAKKQPIPVCLTRKDIKSELERAISSTYMNQNQGTCTSIKIAKLPAHSPAQVLANLSAALPAIVQGIKGGWDNVQSLVLKTNSSAGLPIWSCDLGDGRWVGMEVDDAAESAGAEEEEAKAVKMAEVKKGKKRAAVEDEEEEQSTEVKRKKAKNQEVAAVSSEASKKKSKGDVKPPPPADDDEEEEQSREVKRKKATNHEAAAVTSEASKKKSKGDVKPPPPADDDGPKKKKAKVADDDASGPRKPPKSVSVPTDDAPKKKAKSVDAPTADASKKKAKVVEPEDVPAKPKKEKKVKVEAPAPPTTDELKQKRAGKAGERKKEIVAAGAKESKKGKKAKDALIGRKAGQ